jgi:hypothetical protein
MSYNPFGKREKKRLSRAELLLIILEYFTTTELDVTSSRIAQLVGRYKVTVEVAEADTPQPSR